MVFDRGNTFFYSDKINDCNFFSGFATKLTDNSKIISSFSPISAWQTHSNNIKYLEQPETNIKDIDGFITKTENLLLIVKTADCVPIIFADKKNKIIGVSHQGWKGTLEQMSIKMVNFLIKYGAKKENLLVAIGPAICKKHYPVSADLYHQFAKRFFLREKDDHLDLKQINYQQLLDAGLKPSQIETSDLCTYCEKRLFYSYRREGKEKLGKMINFIAIKS